MFSSLSLSKKLILGFLVISVFVVAMGGIGLYAGKKLNSSMRNLNDNNLIPVADIGNANMAAIYHNRALYDLLSSRPEEVPPVLEGITKYEKRMKELLDKYRKTFLTQKEIELLNKFDQSWPKYEHDAMAAIAFFKDGKIDEASKIVNNEATESFQIVDDLLSEILDFNVELAARTNQEGEDLYSELSKVMMGGMGLSVFLSVGLGLLIARNLSRALGHVAGELTTAAAQTAAASEELSSASQQVSSGTTESASSLEETVAAVEELSSVVNNNAKNARNAAQLAKAGAGNAAAGNEGMKKLIGSMTEISESSKKVEDIIGVIDDISFQINLLALNAAVEAARAGEHGKGFAVVADAVRTLAQKSATAAKDISQLIVESTDKTKVGSELASQMAQSLSDLVLSIEKSATINEEIALASEEQATGISQISKAMQTLDASTQQNAASAEEIAASAEEMSAQALTLQQMVVNLKTIVEGRKAGSIAGQTVHHSDEQAKSAA
ncbi:hypothetical protein AZI86_13350 [Bdellovibrio bacteriovorus]|uniref:Methyl-accepting transducer domain-containing protein n=1 Tax=Bdellovibrio bacteriovorus TaxID=959 RepID=A0A150WJE5_BDEBC|nr:methyl-accepting chemotaxis protein [Bdellovibrio bacteriovorus]KYG63804.1 hypothetical protein AZI86_13350 [Bdellovibrio bacteriovorus]